MPLYGTLDEILEGMDENGFIYGEVVLDMYDLVEADPDGFEDLLSVAMVGSEMLLYLDYRALRVTPDGEIVIGVYGDPRTVVADMYEEDETHRP